MPWTSPGRRCVSTANPAAASAAALVQQARQGPPRIGSAVDQEHRRAADLISAPAARADRARPEKPMTAGARLGAPRRHVERHHGALREPDQREPVVGEAEAGKLLVEKASRTCAVCRTRARRSAGVLDLDREPLIAERRHVAREGRVAATRRRRAARPANNAAQGRSDRCRRRHSRAGESTSDFALPPADGSTRGPSNFMRSLMDSPFRAASLS